MSRKRTAKSLPVEKTTLICPYKTIGEELALVVEKADVALQNPDLEMSTTNTAQKISSEVFAPLQFYSVRQNKNARNADELREVYQLFCALVVKVQEKVAFTPTLCTFLRFANMSYVTFNHYMNQNSELGDVAQEIKNYLSEQTLQGIFGGTTKEISGIFTMKALYGFRENDQPNTQIVNINTQSRSVDEILAEFNKNVKK